MVELFRDYGRIGVIQCWLVNQSKPRLGDWGEWIALKHLLRLRYDVIARNWRIRRGEVDIISYDGDDLVFIEVKTREGAARLPPELNVDEEKQSQLEFLAHSFLGRHELTDIAVRFDLIAVETSDRKSFEIRHYRGFM